MNRVVLLPTRLPALSSRSATLQPSHSLRHLVHTSTQHAAAVNPITAAGPPPPAPVPSVDHINERQARRRAHAEAVGRKGELGAGSKTVGPASLGAAALNTVRKENSSAAGKAEAARSLRRRFWKEVGVEEVDGGYIVKLDSRPLRTPTKEVMLIPASKPHLATALALEWDLLTSAQQALKQHLIPLTSLTSRALDIAAEDASASSETPGAIRTSIATTALRYLDTDTLLCWAPETNIHSPSNPDDPRPSLRKQQEQAAQPVIDFLTTHVWPGAEILPVLEDSILPRPQPASTRAAIQEWILQLPAWELAGLERAFLAGKGLLGAARLVAEWSETLGHATKKTHGQFGVEEAAAVSSVEVKYQTDMWGEVEDTHDVEKEDLRRQLGSVILLVSGTGKQ